MNMHVVQCLHVLLDRICLLLVNKPVCHQSTSLHAVSHYPACCLSQPCLLPFSTLHAANQQACLLLINKPACCQSTNLLLPVNKPAAANQQACMLPVNKPAAACQQPLVAAFHTPACCQSTSLLLPVNNPWLLPFTPLHAANQPASQSPLACCSRRICGGSSAQSCSSTGCW